MNTQALSQELENHNAIKTLESFGQKLKNTKFTKKQLNIFFGTLWAFFREIPTGILSLSLKITDDWMENYNEWEGTAIAAPVLYANVDEYGIQSDISLKPTHHQLFKNLVKILGINENDLLLQENILDDGLKFGKTTREYYRNRSIAEGVGFHLSSELTSSLEFQHFFDGFKAYAEYYNLVGNTQSALSFFTIHTQVEPLHLELGKKVANTYIEKMPRIKDQIFDGAIVFMDGFDRMFKEFNNKLF